MPKDEKNEIIVAVLGNSITAGFGLHAADAFPSLLQKMFQLEGKNVHLIIDGISGSTTNSGLTRLQRLIAKRIDIVLIELGANDGLRGYPIQTIYHNLKSMIELALAHSVKVVLAGMLLPPFYASHYRNAFSHIYRDLAEKYSLALIPFILEGVAGHLHLNLRDGVHPNAEGQKIIAKLAKDYLEPVLKEFSSS
jgi:acyl-CoA thioesterase I